MRAVKTAHARLQNLINRDALAPERRFKPLPTLRLGEPREQTREPVVIELRGSNLPPAQLREQREVAFDPFFNLILGVIALGQDEDHPDREHPSAAQTRMQSVIFNFPVVEAGNIQLHDQTEQERNITDFYMGQLKCLIHASNNTQTISKSPGFISGKRQL